MGGCFEKICSEHISAYDIPRVVRLHSRAVGYMHILLRYFAFYLLIVWTILGNNEQTYLAYSRPEGVVISKMFGVTYLNTTSPTVHRVWDNADYTVPPKENGAFTIITSIQVTEKQSQGQCEEDPSIEDARCENRTCEKNKPVKNGNGIMTGNCIPSTIDPGARVCEIFAWCPVEINDESKRVPLALKDFTVLIINDVQFPEFRMKSQNIPNDMTQREWNTCQYDPNHPRNMNCPVFSVNTIASEAGVNFDALVQRGGAIEIAIEWKCYYKKTCLPTYKFSQLDDVSHNLSRGFHIRYADHWISENGTALRTLYRAYGIRVVTSVQGMAYKMDVLKLAKTFGSLISYTFVASFACRILLSIANWTLKRNQPTDQQYTYFDYAEDLATKPVYLRDALLKKPSLSRSRTQLLDHLEEHEMEEILQYSSQLVQLLQLLDRKQRD